MTFEALSVELVDVNVVVLKDLQVMDRLWSGAISHVLNASDPDPETNSERGHHHQQSEGVVVDHHPHSVFTLPNILVGVSRYIQVSEAPPLWGLSFKAEIQLFHICIAAV